MIFLLASIDANSAYSDVVVIVSAESPITKLSNAQINRIFLGKVDSYPDQRTATPIDQPEGREIRDEFYDKIIHKAPSQVSAYWARVIFTGDGRPPRLVDGDIAVRQAVAADPSAIGYIDGSKVDRSVRIIQRPQ
ncbi:MAG: phosphate ABC transporter substrate-binding protein [Gallionella sp.]